VQVFERRQHLEDVGERAGQRKRIRRAVAVPLGPQLPQRTAADVLHHDVPDRFTGPRVRVLDEVEDAHDVRVLDLGEEPAFRRRGGHRVGVAGVQQALEHHPPVADVAVTGEVDPAEAAVRETADHLVLPGHQIPRGQLGGEREASAAPGAETVGTPRLPAVAPADRLAAGPAEPAVLGDLGVGHDRGEGVAAGHRWHLDEPGAEPSPP
jgi:hypothetical protein